MVMFNYIRVCITLTVGLCLPINLKKGLLEGGVGDARVSSLCVLTLTVECKFVAPIIHKYENTH